MEGFAASAAMRLRAAPALHKTGIQPRRRTRRRGRGQGASQRQSLKEDDTTMRRQESGLSISSTKPRARRGAVRLALLGLLLLVPAALQAREDLNFPDYVQAPNIPRIQVGSATAERLGSVFEAVAGPFSSGHSGDWRLSNEHLSAIFASVELTSETNRLISTPINGNSTSPFSDRRVPGALIDVAAQGASLDFVEAFTQYAGVEPRGDKIAYDTAEAVKREDAVGLRFEDSPFDNSPVRVSTTYWLAPGARYIEIETETFNLPEGEKAPQIGDIGGWAYGMPLLNRIGEAQYNSKTQVETDFYQVQGGDISIGLTPAEGMRLKGTIVGPPYVVNTAYIPAAQDARTTPALASAQTTSTQAITSTTVNGRDSRTTQTAQVDSAAKATTQTASLAKPAVAVSGEPGKPLRRKLWIMRGIESDLYQRIQADRKTSSGTLTGVVADPAGKEMANATLIVSAVDTKNLEKNPTLETRLRSDAHGRYSINLPAGMYYVTPEMKAGRGSSIRIGANVIPGQTQTSNVKYGIECGVKVKVIDAATSKPLAARLRIEPIPPTAGVNFGFPLTAEGYFENAYIPAEGKDMLMPPGQYVIYASHGIGYDIGDRDVRVEEGKIGQLVIPLKQSNPTPGWAHLETGMRTTATPGCMIQPRDAALMCAAEGIDWVFTGDFEKLTDLRPVIRELGLEGVLGASRGFRTLLPAHPEWGQFLVYPVRDDAPDPAEARKQWAGMKTAQEFIAKLRALYPGALIQADLPYTDNGLGYFARKNMDAYEISWEPPSIELNVDALTLFPSRQGWDLRTTKGFWMNNMCQGRFYIANSSNSGTVVFGAEPGYPRLLALIGKDVKPSEKDIAQAMKDRKVQVTTGPFIDFSIKGVLPGGVVDPAPTNLIHARVTAPKWVETTSLSIDKEDAPRVSMMLGYGETASQRFPPLGEEKHEFADMSLKDYMLEPGKDTLAAIFVYGGTPLRPHVPAMTPAQEVFPFAFSFPIKVDENKNGKYDPLKSYAQKGM